MRARGIFVVAVSAWIGAISWACGNTSFSGDGADGGSDASSNDGSVGADGSAGDGGAGDGGGVSSDGSVGSSDAGPCRTSVIVPEEAGVIDCPSPTGTTTTFCSVGTTCCIGGDGQSTCTPGIACGGEDLKWQCEKQSDCTPTTLCCLSSSMQDTSTCPTNVLLTSSSCVTAAACPADAPQMCAEKADCTLPGEKNCSPLYVRFAADSDAGLLVGVCVP